MKAPRRVFALTILLSLLLPASVQAQQWGKAQFSNTPTVGRPGKTYGHPKLSTGRSSQEAIDPSTIHGLIGHLLGNPEPEFHKLTPEEVLEHVRQSRQPHPSP